MKRNMKRGMLPAVPGIPSNAQDHCVKHIAGDSAAGLLRKEAARDFLNWLPETHESLVRRIGKKASELCAAPR